MCRELNEYYNSLHANFKRYCCSFLSPLFLSKRRLETGWQGLFCFLFGFFFALFVQVLAHQYRLPSSLASSLFDLQEVLHLLRINLSSWWNFTRKLIVLAAETQLKFDEIPFKNMLTTKTSSHVSSRNNFMKSLKV